MGELNRRGVKAFAVLSFMAFTSCAIAGRGAFHLFTPPPVICRTRDAAHDQGREVAPLMRHRTPRTSQRCGPAGTYAAQVPRKGRPQRVTGTFPEALKQGRPAMPYQKRRAAAFGNGQSARLKVRQ